MLSSSSSKSTTTASRRHHDCCHRLRLRREQQSLITMVDLRDDDVSAFVEDGSTSSFNSCWRNNRHRTRRRVATKLSSKSIAITRMMKIIILLVALAFPKGKHFVSAHGYMKTPRSRNLVAYQDKNYEVPDINDPKPEDCPHCLNRGGNLAQCGILYGTHEGMPWERNYDHPLNINNEPMKPNLQGVYQEGSIIEIEILVTTHHKGHFEFALCPIDDQAMPMVTPTEECFEQHKLLFVEDVMYGAPPDPNYPERAYIAPASYVTYIEPIEDIQPVVGAYYKMKFQLPEGIAGDLVLLQWYYLTANSCKHEGYAEYDFPHEWGSDTSLYPGLPDCGVVPPDGDGVPEQFWNCAEIRIIGQGSRTTPLTSPTSDSGSKNMIQMARPVPPTPPPKMAPNTLHPTITVIYYPDHAAQVCRNDGLEPRWLDPDKEIFTSLEECCKEHFEWEYDTCLKNSPNEQPASPNSNINVAQPMTAAAGAAVAVCTNAASIYYEATQDCTGYYVCNNGQQGEIYECATGTLYDESTQMCNWATEVTCISKVPESPFDEFGNPRPTKSPTTSPTNKPNDLLAWNGPKTSAERGHSKTIIGYYASWQWYDRDGLAAPASFDFSKITRANFAFFQITPEGYIYGTDMWADPITLFGFYDWMAPEGSVYEYCSWDEPNTPPNCMSHHYEEGLIYLAHKAGAEVYPSIGGWSLSDPFPVMAASATARARFASQCVDLIKNYNFDGIDLDWEYPGYEPHSGTPDDTVNFNLLLDDVRTALDELEAETGKYYGLTAALPCGPSIIANQDIEHVGRLLTELNLMTYDFHGAWNEKTGVNAPLYDQINSTEFSVHGCVNNWLEGGAPKEKINIGFPFYGRSFLRAEHLYESHEGNDDTTWHVDEGVPQYYNIMAKMDEYTSVRDEQTMTQYAYGDTGMVSYDDERAICDKTEYAQVHDLNGYIIWELSGDLMPDLSTPLLDAANAKLLDPSLDCASLDQSTIANIIGEAHPQSSTVTDISGAVYYPDHSRAICLSDGLQPGWLSELDIDHSLLDCCSKHFEWNLDSCIENSPDTIDTPLIIPPTRKPASQPTPYPSRNPITTKAPTRRPTPGTKQKKSSLNPTAKVMLNSPTSSFETNASKPAALKLKTPIPTREPTRKPKKHQTPTPTRNISVSGESPIAASFLGVPAASFLGVPASSFQAVKTPKPTRSIPVSGESPIAASFLGYQVVAKGQEQMGQSTNNQIQMSAKKLKKQKKTSKQKGGQRTKKRRRKKLKRQKRKQQKRNNTRRLF